MIIVELLTALIVGIGLGLAAIPAWMLWQNLNGKGRQ